MLTKSLIFISVFVSSLAIDEFIARDHSEAIPKVKFWDINFIETDKTIYSKFDRNGRIVGGNEAVPNAHPYQAALFLRFPSGTGLCGGCLITDRHVISAAHCLDFTFSVQVLLGGHDIFTVEPTQVRLTVDRSNYIVHESYDPRLLYNDVALLPLPQNIAFNDYIHPIALPTDMMDEHFAGEIATVSGKKYLNLHKHKLLLNETSFKVGGEGAIKVLRHLLFCNTQETKSKLMKSVKRYLDTS